MLSRWESAMQWNNSSKYKDFQRGKQKNHTVIYLALRNARAVNTHVENQNLDTRSQQKCSACCPSDKWKLFFSKHIHLMMLLPGEWRDEKSMHSEANSASERRKKGRIQVNTQENKDTREVSLKAIFILYAKKHWNYTGTIREEGCYIPIFNTIQI